MTKGEMLKERDALTVKGFKLLAVFGAVSTNPWRKRCLNCRNYNHTDVRCQHPAMLSRRWYARGFPLGAHPERMGCYRGFEAADGKQSRTPAPTGKKENDRG